MSGLRYFSFCSGVPLLASISMGTLVQLSIVRSESQ